MTLGRLHKMIPIRPKTNLASEAKKIKEDGEEKKKKLRQFLPEKRAACQVHFLTTARAPPLPWRPGCAAVYRQSQQEARPIIAAASMGQA